MKINHAYKYATLLFANYMLILQFSYDNTAGEDCYTIKSNISFYSNGELAPCVGVGNDERSAIKDFIDELKKLEDNQYNRNVLLNGKIVSYELNEIVLPYKVTIVNDVGERGTFYYNKNGNGLTLLTNKGQMIVADKEITTVLKSFDNSIFESKDTFSNVFLRENLFYPTFDNLCY